MKLQQTSKFNLNSRQTTPNANKNQVAFKGAETVLIQALRFLDTNQAWGAIAVDVGCMGIPRTTVDFTRGPDAGLETARREFSSTGNHTLIGVYGATAALLLARGLNDKYGMKANKMFISNETADIFAQHWKDAKDGGDKVRQVAQSIIKSVHGFNPHDARADEKGWVPIETDATESSVEKLMKVLEKEPESMSKESREHLKVVIGSSIGSEGKVRLVKTVNGKEVVSHSTLEAFIDNLYQMAKALKNDKVAAEFKGDIANNAFLKGLKGMNKNVSIAAMMTAIGVGLCVQPVNAYLTKLKTGKEGFVGVEGREPDKSNKFKLLKAAVAGIFGFGAISTIGGIGNLEKFLGKIHFKGFNPTIPQFKLIYGMTIMSRFMSARDKNELREASIKDTLGFVSWLILGGFVSKLTAAGFEKLSMFKNSGEKFIRYVEETGENGSMKWLSDSKVGKGFKWLTESNIITRDEVLLGAFKKMNLSKELLNKDGKALNFKEMFEKLSELSKSKNSETAKIAKMAVKKVRYLGFVQAAGYLYSGLALGIGIPKLNIAITKHFEAKRKTKEQQAKQQKQEIQTK